MFEELSCPLSVKCFPGYSRRRLSRVSTCCLVTKERKIVVKEIALLGALILIPNPHYLGACSGPIGAVQWPEVNIPLAYPTFWPKVPLILSGAAGRDNGASCGDSYCSSLGTPGFRAAWNCPDETDCVLKLHMQSTGRDRYDIVYLIIECQGSCAFYLETRTPSCRP